jgi:hypothetical protein
MGIKLHGTCMVAVAGVLTAGCSSLDSPPGVMVGPVPATVVEVTNHNCLDINVYAVRSGTRMRLGTVRSMARSTFRVPESALSMGGRIRLMADPIGSPRGLLTEPILVQRGDRIEWQVENSLPLSHYSVRPR